MVRHQIARRRVGSIGITLLCTILAGCGDLAGPPAAYPPTAFDPYLWRAAREVLWEEPTQSADPAAGSLVTAWSAPRGATTMDQYRAVVSLDYRQAYDAAVISEVDHRMPVPDGYEMLKPDDDRAQALAAAIQKRAGELRLATNAYR